MPMNNAMLQHVHLETPGSAYAQTLRSRHPQGTIASKRISGSGSRRYRLHAGQGSLQGGFLGMVERCLQHRAALTLEALQHLVAADLADQHEQCRGARLNSCRDLLHPSIVDTDI